jgi:hypothetical protein
MEVNKLWSVPAALLTGPLIVLALLLAIPATIAYVALGGATLVLFCWSLWWGFIWAIGADPDAGKIFLQSILLTCACAGVATAIVWGMAAIKDWLFPKKKPLTIKPDAIYTPPDNVVYLNPPPANDWTPKREAR